jgi:hypothetical protein
MNGIGKLDRDQIKVVGFFSNDRFMRLADNS